MAQDPATDPHLTLEVEGKSWPVRDGDVIGRLGTVGGEALRGYDVLSRQHLKVELQHGDWRVTLLPKAGNVTLCNGAPMVAGTPVPVTQECELRVVDLVLRLIARPKAAGEVSPADRHPVALLTLGKDLKIEWRNIEAERLLGSASTAGSMFLELLETGATLRLRYALMALKDGGELEEAEVASRTEDGRPWLAIRASRRGSSLFLALRDVTHEREHRAAVRLAAGRLDARVGALTTLLTAKPFMEGDLAAALPLLAQDAAELLEDTTVSAWLASSANARAEAPGVALVCRALTGLARTRIGMEVRLPALPAAGEVPPGALAALQASGLLEETTAGAWMEPISDEGWLVFQRGDAARAWLAPESRLIALTVALGRQLFANLQRREASRLLEAREEALSNELSEAAHYFEQRLPALITKGAAEVDWVFKPCGKLGGDVFGYEWLDEHRFAIYIADVMGHGCRSSLHALSLSQTLKLLLARGAGDDPATWLAALNREFPMKHHEGLLWTMWCGLYDRRTRTLRHASGGHPPALLCQGGKVEELSSAGPVLGAMEDAEYPSAATLVSGGAKLFLYTDGVYEYPTAEDDAGTLQDFTQAVAGATGMNDGECAFLHTRAAALCAEPEFPDDFTIVRVRFAV